VARGIRDAAWIADLDALHCSVDDLNARGRRGIAKHSVEPIAGDVKASVRGPSVAIRSGPTGDVALVRMEAGGTNPIELAQEVKQLSSTRWQGLCERRV
jgi:hypothetical protein